MIAQIWILVGLITVLTRAVLNPYQKSLLSDFTESQVMFIRDSFALLLFVPTTSYLILTRSVFGTTVGLQAMLASGVLNIIGAFIVFAALNREDASIVIPLSSITPVLTSVIEPFLTSQDLSLTVFLGCCLAGFGASIVSWKSDSIKDFVTSADRIAVSLALSSNLIFGFAATFDGIATSSFNPIIVSAVIIMFIWIGSSIRLIIEDPSNKDRSLTDLVKRDTGYLGILQFVASTTTFITFSLAPSATQSTIIFQMTTVAVVVTSRVGLKEEMFGRRLVGSLLIFAGAILGIVG